MTRILNTRNLGFSEASNEDMKVQHTGDETGEDADYIHMRIQGNQVETLKVIRDTQTGDTGGRASFLKREGKLVFKIKQEVTRQSKNQRMFQIQDSTGNQKNKNSV